MSGDGDLFDLPAGVEAVPAARRHARRLLAGAAEELVGDVELVVSELVANAALHGAPPLRLRLRGGPRVRVEVHDGGRAVPVRVRSDDAAMTGRGLGMVAVLASSWGVDVADGPGKVVWAELDTAGAPAGEATPGELDVEALLASWGDDGEQRHTVTLGAVATELLVAAKAHIDNVVRELTLLGEAGGGAAPSPAVADLVRAATVDFAEARAEIKRQAALAATRGDAVTDLVLHLPASAADAGERYLAALDEADRWARSARLLTLAPPRVHRLFRRWYVGAIVDALRALAAGQAPPAPVPLQVLLAREVTTLDEALAASRRDQG